MPPLPLLPPLGPPLPGLPCPGLAGRGAGLGVGAGLGASVGCGLGPGVRTVSSSSVIAERSLPFSMSFVKALIKMNKQSFTWSRERCVSRQKELRLESITQ